MDKDIIYENKRYYETRMLRTKDTGEKAVLLAAIGRINAGLKVAA